MEVRDMLADEGMLYDEVCLGTKATTQRSDTCEDTLFISRIKKEGSFVSCKMSY